MPPSTTPPPPLLGRYRIVRRLGAGGMAEVFLAKSTGAEGLEKILVVKRVLPAFARSPKFISMFVDEAKVAMRLNHPNIVQVYNFEQVREEFLLAMEFVDGLDLGRLVTGGRRKSLRMPYAVSALVVMEVAKGLDYAHNRKDESGQPMDIVHRDVSPQNVLVSYDGAVKVADFGIARARMVSEETGVIKGKFSYMSPEQARGQRVDRRSDVYSLGVLFAELLMNRSMYPGLQGMEVLEQVRDGRVTFPRQVDPDVPLELEAICRRAMSFDREERYQTCRSLAGALSRWLHEQDELHDAADLERFLNDVAPREVTSPDGMRRASEAPLATSATQLSMVGRELRERRSVVAVGGRVRDASDEPLTGVEKTGQSASDQATRVLDDIAFKYDAILDWPEGTAKRSFRFLLGLGRVSIDDPLHATRLALDVLEALEGLSADSLVPLTASVGLSRGTVSTIRSGQQGRIRYEPVGNVFEVAKQLADAAKGGEVIATGEVYRLARRAFAFDERDVRDVTVTTHGGGAPRAIRAYRLRGAKTREERAAEAEKLASQVGLIGRSNEIEALLETWQETASTSRSSYLALVGDLGVGKTALVSAAVGRFTPDPRLLHVECAFGAGELPYAAAAELVREACGVADGTSPEATREALRAAVRKIVKVAERRQPVYEGLVELVAPVDRDAAAAGDRTQKLAHAVRDLLGALARQSPLVLWVDALQFADTPSLQLMGRLLAQPYEVPLMVVLGTRPDPRVEPLLRGVPRIELGELEPHDAGDLVRAHLGVKVVPPDVQQAIVHRAGGNPFFLMELVDALVDRGVLIAQGEGETRRVVRKLGAAFSLPTTLEDVIAARIAELPEKERLALRWLAVAGPGTREGDLSDLAGSELGDSISALSSKGLIEVRAGGGLYFASAVVRHVAYESADATDRVRMHKRVGSWLVGLESPVPPARIARHHELAGDGPAAALAWREAGRAAMATYSNREALRFFARALGLLPDDSSERFAIHETRESLLRAQGLRAEQRIELEAMRAIAERTRDPRKLAIAFNRLARHDLDASRPAGVDAMLRRALDASIEAGDKGAEVEALRLLGHLRRDQGDTDGALEALDRALARAGLDPEQLAQRGMTLAQKAILLWRTGRLEACADAAAESMVIFRRLGQKGQEAFALNILGVCMASRGNFEDAIACIRASIRLDREAGDRIHIGRKASNVGQMYAELGDVTRAREFLERALAVFETIDDHSARSDTLSAMAELLIEQVGDLEAAQRALDDAVRIAERIGDPYDLAHERIVRSALFQARGDDVESERAAREGVSHARAAATVGYELLAGARRASALARLSRADEAMEVAGAVDRAVREHGAVEREDRIHLELGLAWARAGDRARATRALEAARAVVEARLEQIRDEALRERYLASAVVRAIRAEPFG